MITASFKMGQHDMTEIPVLNPGGWFGKAWVVEIGGSYSPFFVVVEADHISDVINEFSDNEKYGHNIHVSDVDLPDYPENEREYDGSGRVIDTGDLMVHGRENTDTPYCMRYFGDNLPSEGVTPKEYTDKYVYDQHDE